MASNRIKGCPQCFTPPTCCASLCMALSSSRSRNADRENKILTGSIPCCRHLQVLGARDFPGGCVDISLLLSGPVHGYSTVVSHPKHVRSNASLDVAACLLTAELPTLGSGGGQTECDSHVWDMRESQAEAEYFTQRLRLHSTCNVGGMGLQVN